MERYFYRRGQRVKVSEIENVLAVQVVASSPTNVRAEALGEPFDVAGAEAFSFAAPTEELDALASAGWVFIKSSCALAESARSSQDRPPELLDVGQVYQQRDGHLLIGSHTLLVQFPSEVSDKAIRRELKKHKLKIVRRLAFSANQFQVEVAPVDDLLNVANALLESGVAVAAEPVFIEYNGKGLTATDLAFDPHWLIDSSAGSGKADIAAELPPLAIGLPLDDSIPLARIASAVQRMWGSEASSRQQVKEARKIRKLTLKGISETLDLSRPIWSWPPQLYIPRTADWRKYWFTGPPSGANRYALAWKSTPISWANANAEDGSLFATAGMPTAKGAIQGMVEAGLGIRFDATHSLSRIRLKPRLLFRGLFEWNINPPPSVLVDSHVIGSILVGGFVLNPLTRRYESIPNSPLRQHVLFNRRNKENGSNALETLPFDVGGNAAAADVLVQGGRRYLLSIVAQLYIKVKTTDSYGRPVNVTSGDFHTFGTVTGIVDHIWLKETVYIA